MGAVIGAGREGAILKGRKVAARVKALDWIEASDTVGEVGEEGMGERVGAELDGTGAEIFAIEGLTNLPLTSSSNLFQTGKSVLILFPGHSTNANPSIFILLALLSHSSCFPNWKQFRQLTSAPSTKMGDFERRSPSTTAHILMQTSSVLAKSPPSKAESAIIPKVLISASLSPR